MPEGDGLRERGRSLEEDYFRKKDRELIEKLRQTAAADAARQDLGRQTGLDAELVDELHELGFTPDTIALLPLVPVLQMAWAEGGITKPERELLIRLARSRGIAEGSAADAQLTAWMAERPSEAMFARAGRLIRAMLDAGGETVGNLSADELVRHCEAIAAASGGILGIGRISAEEKSLLAGIVQDLRARNS